MDYLKKNKKLKGFFIGIFFILAIGVILFSLVDVTEATTINKDVNNKNIASKNLNVKSITISKNTEGGLKGAVDKSKSDTIIYLKKGVYKFNNSNIKINKTLTIVGKGSTKKIVIVSESGDRIFNVHKQGKLKLINITIKNCISSKKGGVIYNKGALSLKNCAFIDCFAFWGGTIYSVSNYSSYISNCRFIYSSDVVGSAIYNINGKGSRITIKNSYFKSCGIINKADNTIVFNNTIICGVYNYLVVGIHITGDKNKIFNNKLYGRFDSGIHIWGNRNIISKNQIFGKSKSNMGISMGFNTFNKITRNTISNFNYGVYVYNGFKTNKISYNKFIKNNVGLASYYKFKNKSNIFKGNYKNIIKIREQYEYTINWYDY